MQLTIRDVGKLFNISERDVEHWIDERGLPAYRISDQFRFNRAELLEWATANQIPMAPGLFSRGRAASPLSLAHALECGGVFRDLKGQDKMSILKAVTQAVPLPPKADRDHLFQMVWAREALASTGIGKGIAVPHVRNPVIFSVDKPLAALFFLEKPVEFGALDGKPVHALFTFISPTVRVHLQLLSRLSFALRDAAFRDLIEKHGEKVEIVQSLQAVELKFPASSG